MINETSVKASEMSVFVKKTSQSKILDQLLTSEDTSSRSSSEMTKSDQMFNKSDLMFNEHDLMFDELVSSSTKTFVAVEISEKKEMINLFRKDQSMNKEIT